MTSSHPRVIAFLGSAQSWTHQAAIKFFDTFPQNENNIYLPCDSIPQVFKAVWGPFPDESQLPSLTQHHTVTPESHEILAHYAIVPYENSTNGSVIISHDYLRSYALNFALQQTSSPAHTLKPSLSLSHVIGEVELPINICLLARKETRTDSAYAGIRRVVSHPQVWTQCERFLRRKLPHIERVNALSTSDAALEVIHDVTGSTVALGSANLARRFAEQDLIVLEENIQDMSYNRTRFLVLASRTAEIDRRLQRFYENPEYGECHQIDKPISSNSTSFVLWFVAWPGLSEHQILHISDQSGFPIHTHNKENIADLIDIIGSNRCMQVTAIHNRPRQDQLSRAWTRVYMIEMTFHPTVKTEHEQSLCQEFKQLEDALTGLSECARQKNVLFQFIGSSLVSQVLRIMANVT